MVTKLKGRNELREELIAKREELDKFVKQATHSGRPDTWDLDAVTVGGGENSEAKAAWFRGMNSEIDELTDAYQEVVKREEAIDLNGKALEHLKGAGGVHHPGGGGQNVGGADDGAQWGGKSLGRIFTESAAFKDFKASAKRGPVVDITVPEEHFENLLGKTAYQMKTLLTETGFAPQAVRTGLIVPGALRRPVVADLMPQGTTTQIAIVYMEETTTTNAADSVSEGAEKPESALSFTQRTAPVQKIATVLPVTDELMADEPAMRAYVEARLRIFLQLEEERQLLNGDGTPPDIRGLFNVVGTQTQSGAGLDITETVYMSMTLIEVNAFLEASGIVLHPTDWESVRLMRSSDGIYIWGSPSEVGPDRMWGLPVVRTTAVTAGTGLVAAFDTATQIFRRNEVSFAVSDQHEDFFIKNKLMLRVEERLALAVYRPSGIVELSALGT